MSLIRMGALGSRRSGGLASLPWARFWVAEQGVTMETGVAAWAPTTGGLPYTSTVLDNQPALVASAGLNNRLTVACDGINDVMRANGSNAEAAWKDNRSTTGVTILWVGNVGTITGQTVCIGDLGAITSGAVGFAIAYTAWNRFLYVPKAGGPANVSLVPAGAPPLGPNWALGRYSSALSPNCELWWNGSLIASGDFDNLPFVTDDSTISGNFGINAGYRNIAIAAMGFAHELLDPAAVAAMVLEEYGI